MTGNTYTPGQASLPTPNSTKSFWHSQPSKTLIGHRTTSSLPTKADIVIIGSGISGASAAYHLHEEHYDNSPNVVMLDAREACWGATGRNGGHCQPMLFASTPEIGSFETRNYEAIKALIAKHDISCEWRSLSGCHASMSKSMFQIAVEEVKTLQRLDPELGKQCSIITKESQNPSLEDLRVPRAAGAIVQQNAASLWPYKFVSWILESLLADRCLNLQTNTPVTSLQKVEDGWIVHTPRGMLAAPKVLLATNAYTSHLVSEFSDLIVPVRGEMSALLPPASMRLSSTINKPLEYSYVFVGHGKQNINQDDYLVQRPFSPSRSDRGELMFGGGRSYAHLAGVGISDDSAIDPPAAAYLRRELNVVLDLQNQDEELEATWEWSGIMGYSRDGHPWVGEVSEALGKQKGEGLWVCAGYTGHGMPNTWLCGKAVAGLVSGKGEEEVDLPGGYRISGERVRRARELDEVWLADSKA